MRSDILNENSQQTGGKKLKVVNLTVAHTLTNEDSGKVYACDSAGGAYEITLPTSLEDGVYFKFIIWEETPTADITIAAGSAIISGVNKDAGGDAANSTAGTQVSNIILHTSDHGGDWVNLIAVNGEWVIEAFSSINQGIQTS